MRKIKYDDDMIWLMYVVVEFLPGEEVNPLAKFGYIQVSSHTPLDKLKRNLRRYNTYKPNMYVRYFRITCVELKKASSYETVLKRVLEECKEFTEGNTDNPIPSSFSGIL